MAKHIIKKAAATSKVYFYQIQSTLKKEVLMLRKSFAWTFTFAFLLPVYGYADGTIVPEFKTVGECQEWVRDYANSIPLHEETFKYDLDAHSWFYYFSVNRPVSSFKCESNDCTWYDYGNEYGPATGGCDMIGHGGDTFLLDAWVIAKRNLNDQVSIYESRKNLLPEYRYGKVCRYQEGTDPEKGDCYIMMHDYKQPCATLNPINFRLHIPCINDGSGILYWKEADFIEPWKFEVSNEGWGFDAPGLKDDCATYTVSTGIIHVPCVMVGEKSYWADFQVSNTTPVQLNLVGVGEN